MDISRFKKLERSYDSLLEKFEYLIPEGLKVYESFSAKLFGLNELPDKANEQIAEQIFYKNLNDRENKFTQKLYYISNALCFINVTKTILTEDFINSFKQYFPKNDDVLVYNYHHLFQYLLYDSILLLKDFEKDIVGKDSGRFKIWKNRNQHNLTLYHNLKQDIFGQISFHSSKDLEMDFSVTRIRNMIEVRLRQAFDIMGAYSSVSDSFHPISMENIFSILKRNSDDIIVDIPIHIIQRIYGWANIYVHAGIKDYLWKSIFILDYFKTFMSGKTINGKWNADSGIRISKETYTKIRNELKELLGSEKEILSIRTPKVDLF